MGIQADRLASRWYVAHTAPLNPRLTGATGRERLAAAGITPCGSCRWGDGELLGPCAYHAAQLREAANAHLAKFPPRRR